MKKLVDFLGVSICAILGLLAFVGIFMLTASLVLFTLFFGIVTSCVLFFTSEKPPVEPEKTRIEEWGV